MKLTDTIRRLLAEKFESEDFADCFTVDVQLHPGNRLVVLVDCDTGLSVARCAQVSRYLEAYLDEAVWKDQKYVLEVSSPGVDRPLAALRQYRKNIGREVKVSTEEGEEKGLLTGVSDTAIELEQDIVRKEGKKKIREKIRRSIPFDRIRKTVVQISFNRKK